MTKYQNSRLSHFMAQPKRSGLKLSLLMAVVIVLTGLFWAKPAYASPTIPPDPNGTIPSANYTYLTTDYLAKSPCTVADHQPQSPALTRWVSLSNNIASTSVTVPFGTPSISLRFNDGGVVCYNDKKVSTLDIVRSAAANPAGTFSANLV